MFKDFSRMSLAQRRLVFFFVFGGGVALLLGITAVLVASALNANARQQGVALTDGVTVRQWAALPGNDAYPAAVTIAPDGTVYTGSYASGALYRIALDGSAIEMPGTRDAIGAALALAFVGDALLVVDQIDTDPRSAGGSIVRVPLNVLDADDIEPFFALPPEGFIAPSDIALDADGMIYVSDAGRNQVYRFDGNGGDGGVWWVPPSYTTGARMAIIGLAFDPTTNALLIGEPETNVIFRVNIADGATTELYRHGAGADFPPGFNGMTVIPDGTIYVAALGQNGIALLTPPAPDAPPAADGTPASGTLTYIAGAFRGAADVVYDTANTRLIVPNFDQSSLVVPLVQPQLPFALDVIEFGETSTQGA
jgi:sugar lactone lactonase YvrE